MLRKFQNSCKLPGLKFSSYSFLWIKVDSVFISIGYYFINYYPRKIVLLGSGCWLLRYSKFLAILHQMTGNSCNPYCLFYSRVFTIFNEWALKWNRQEIINLLSIENKQFLRWYTIPISSRKVGCHWIIRRKTIVNYGNFFENNS